MHSLKVLDQDFDSSGAIFLPLTSQLKTKQKKKIFNSAITASISNMILTQHWFFVPVAVQRHRFH